MVQPQQEWTPQRHLALNCRIGHDFLEANQPGGLQQPLGIVDSCGVRTDRRSVCEPRYARTGGTSPERFTNIKERFGLDLPSPTPPCGSIMDTYAAHKQKSSTQQNLS
jgi:hypothetical protein